MSLDGTLSLEYDNPAAFTAPDASAMPAIVEALDLGFLPGRGTVLDQPARLMDSVRVWRWAVELCRRKLKEREVVHE